VVNRIVAMLNRVGYGEALVFSGGVARNPCIVEMLRERLDNIRVESPPAPDIVGALGAALHASRSG
jgi:activator of 2-hydroxyglutaryl-CoA dehydratase